MGYNDFYVCAWLRTILTGAAPNLPGSGKDVSKARMSRVTLNLEEDGYEEDTNSWANLWSGEQKSHMRLCMRIRLPHKPKSDNYMQSDLINEVDRWRGRNVWCNLSRGI